MSPHARALLAEVRRQTLPRAHRQALLRSVERRLALGEVAGIEHALQHAPKPSPQELERSWRAGTLLKVGIASLMVGLGATLAVLSPDDASVVEGRAAPPPSVAAAVQPTESARKQPPAKKSPRAPATPDPAVESRAGAPTPPPASSGRGALARAIPVRQAVPAPNAITRGPEPPATAADGKAGRANDEPSEPAPRADARSEQGVAEQTPPTELRTPRSQHAREVALQEQSPQPEAVATLEDELGLLSAAQRAMREGLPERALLALAEHAWRFPHGQLTDAREVARIAALCQAGNHSLARTERARFLERYPQSPFIDRVRGLCR